MTTSHSLTRLIITTVLAFATACSGRISSEDAQEPGQTPPEQANNRSQPDAGPDAHMELNNPNNPTNPNNPIDPDNPTSPSLSRIDPNTLNQDRLFMCDGQPVSSPMRLRRMTQPEHTRARVSGRIYAPARNPLQPLGSNLYSTYDVEVSLDTATLDQYLSMGEVEVFTSFMENRSCITNKNSVPDDACVDAFAREFLERRILYRPASAGEVERLATLAKRAFALEA